MKYDIGAINRLNILEVADRLGMEVKKKGSTYMTCCFWHPDTNPSMKIYPKTNTCHCFVCGRTTNVLGLIEGKLNTNFHGATYWLETNNLTPLTPSMVFTPPSVPPFPGGQKPVGRGRQVGKTRLRKERLLARPKISIRKKEDFYVFPSDYLDGKMTMENSFVRCLVELFGGDRAAEVVRMYRLGSWPVHGRYPDVMFPSIDRYGRIRDIKIQAYDCDPRSERFSHREQTCYWLSSVVFPEQRFDRECLFGEHLLNEQFQQDPEGFKGFHKKTVMVVESPKNACLGAAFCPDLTWVAAGNKGMLSTSLLECLKGRNVIINPDMDAYDSWKEIADRVCFKCLPPTPPKGMLKCPPKWDIGDKIVEICSQGHK